MRVKEIEIVGLFGYFNHRVPLKTQEHITIIHGPNGVGKTTILRLTCDLFSRRFHSLLVTPFKRIVVRFSPKGTLRVDRIDAERGEGATPKLKLQYQVGQKRITHTVTSEMPRDLRRRLPSIERMVDHLERVGLNQWHDELADEDLSLDEVILRYGHLLPPSFREYVSPFPEGLEEFDEILDGIDIFLVETQRLFTTHRREPEDYRRRVVEGQRMTVEQLSEDMVGRIQSTLRESGSLSASLDRTFPQRLLSRGLPRKATDAAIRDLYSSQSAYRYRLMDAGLIAEEDQVSLPDEEIGKNERKVLWIYLSDVDEKLKVFDPLLQRIELFKDVVNSRFSYKRFHVSKDEGFLFYSYHDGSRIPLRALSSGEQHELVLAYQLLFRAKKGSLIFIDEPELSLHVTWQRQFLEDIARISRIADLDFLIATHSPSIIHNRRDLMVSLAKGED